MVIQTRKVYLCGYCRKKYLSKGHCKNHELKCSQRPGKDNICWTCQNLNTEVIESKIGDNTVLETNLYSCLAKSVALKPSMLGDEEALRMPNRICSDYKRKADKGLKV